MNKQSVSLTLSEEVIFDIDEMVDELGLSRSKIINHILSENLKAMRENKGVYVNGITKYRIVLDLNFEGKG